jgi:very-short-patch-repair endonuclease
VDEYARACQKVKDLSDEREAIKAADKTLEVVRQHAPRLAEDLAAVIEDESLNGRLHALPEAWRWAQARTWLKEYINREDDPSLSRRLRQIEDEIGRCTAKLAALCAWMFCATRMNDDHRRNMEAWQQSILKGGKFTGKYAPKHRRDAQKYLNKCRDAVPAWIMPLHRVWDTVDPTPGMFDVIIVDEASQCGFEAFPLMYLGEKILIVGDDKQISPEAVGIPRDSEYQWREELLQDFNFKSTFDVEASLFSQGKLRFGTGLIVLREHFRCMPEIIRFSNDLCYSDTPLIPLRQPQPGRLDPLVHTYVPTGYREGSDSKVINKPEAKAIVDKVVDLCHDERYKDKTMGVIVLQGDAQAALIEGLLLDRLGAKELEKRRLLCGNPYTFQGDERDIILLSMVAAPNERIGPMTKETDRRRFNVAASRARDQMWLFHSVTREDLSTSCFRRRLLEFFENTRPPEIVGIKVQELQRVAAMCNRSIEKAPRPFESWFEVDVALEIANRDYQIIPQFEVAGKRIDIVIEGGHARLAVECDGDEWHGVAQYEQDMQRQRMLERSGWVFYRIRSSRFYGNRRTALDSLWTMLEERGINPQVRPAEVIEKQVSKMEPDPEKVEVGDTVGYVEVEDPDKEKQALLTNGPSNADWGTINVNTPIAQALMGARLGDVVVAILSRGPKQIIIKGIKKPERRT